jgi:hypothetical protein
MWMETARDERSGRLVAEAKYNDLRKYIESIKGTNEGFSLKRKKIDVLQEEEIDTMRDQNVEHVVRGDVQGVEQQKAYTVELVFGEKSW